MARSIQTVVSSGSLVILGVTLDYYERDDITVYFDDVAQLAGWGWVGTTDKTIVFDPAVPAGVTVKLQRRTDVDQMKHIFTSGAQFKNTNVDTNFLQLLHAVQEIQESGVPPSAVGGLDMANEKITSLAAGTTGSDAVNKAQMEAAIASAGGWGGTGLLNSENTWGKWQYINLNDVALSGDAGTMYGWVAALTRATGTKRVVPGYFVGEASGGSGIIWGVATEVWSGTRAATASASTTLVAAEISCVSQYSNQVDHVVGLNPVFKNRPDSLLNGAVRSGLGSNRYNKNSKALWITSQWRSTAGEYCGWTRGLMFDTNSLDRDADGKAVAIDMSLLDTSRADLLKFPDGTYLNSGGQLTWFSVTSFGAGFSLYGPSTPVGYRKEPNNMVRLKGALSTAGATNVGTAFTLPAGYRPAQTVLHAGYGASFVQIDANGTVHPTWGTDPGVVLLDGVCFSTV